MDNKPMRGVRGSDSCQVLSRSNITALAYLQELMTCDRVEREGVCWDKCRQGSDFIEQTVLVLENGK